MVEDKIIEIFKSSGMTRVEFAEKLQISNATLSHLTSGRNKASLDLVITILTYFPQISAEWLILNKGEMYHSNNDMGKLKEELGKHLHKLKDLNHLMGNTIHSIDKELTDLK